MTECQNLFRPAEQVGILLLLPVTNTSLLLSGRFWLSAQHLWLLPALTAQRAFIFLVAKQTDHVEL